MESSHKQAGNFFDVTADADGILRITPREEKGSDLADPLLWLEKLAALMITLLDPAKQITGILYHSKGSEVPVNYKALFTAATHQDFYGRLQKLAEWASVIRQAKIPIISVITGKQDSRTLAPALWSHYIIGTKDVQIHFPEANFGIMPLIGATVPAIIRTSLEQSIQLLIKGTALNSQQASAAGLIDQLCSEQTQALKIAAGWIAGAPAGYVKPSDSKTQMADADLQPVLEAFKRKANLKYPGIYSCFELIKAAYTLPLEGAILAEATHYAQVMKNSHALAITRTSYYGVQHAKQPPVHTDKIVFKKIGVIGAGIMGSGIAYEIARAGLQAVLKDTTLELAEKGRQYTAKCCDKQMRSGKMTMGKKEAMLALILPTDDYTQLQDTDIIIEAVFEQAALKAKVIKESEGFLVAAGIFATNTTSLPITRLSDNSRHPENFIGLHFFSPVDRMPLVEIILGKQTSRATLATARALVLKLGKTPITVHDGPAFFTSRIFFNYLLEAVTMLIEGVDARAIETQATAAGFAVSPLAVLDEISLPLMLQVYDQLPALSASQKRCYHFIQNLTDQGRLGRKSGKGFYQYDPATGKKELCLDLPHHKELTTTQASLIRTRLLHVMALDSYRCLESGILSQPVDGDLGSILGVGYAAHTGGVFAHMDQVGLERFVQDCDAFKEKGEQWEVPASLKALAKKQYRFYKGFDSNWPVA